MRAVLGVVSRVLVVTAHPDDESFGLAPVLAAFVSEGIIVDLLCLTRGESSTLGPGSQDLAVLRAAELAAATKVLGLNNVLLLDYPDGRLGDVIRDELVAHIVEAGQSADAFLVFDEGGISGHPDHERATEAVLAAAAMLQKSVLAWAVSREVADQLNAEFGTSFLGRDEDELDIALEVDRAQQLRAIACHGSQSQDNPVLWRRLSLSGNLEWLRRLSPKDRGPRSAGGPV